MFSFRGFLEYRLVGPWRRLFLWIGEFFSPGFEQSLYLRGRERRRQQRFRKEPELQLRIFREWLEENLPDCEPQPGDTVLDLGANEGWFSLLMGRSGATVLAFEPNSSVCRVAEERCAHLSNVTLVNVAVSQETSVIDLYFPKDFEKAPTVLSEYVSTVRDNSAIDTTRRRSVFSIGLMEVMSVFSNVKLLKVDVEGAEIELWKAIKSNHHKIEFLAMEVHPQLVGRQSGWVAEVERFIRQNGLEQKWKLGWP